MSIANTMRFAIRFLRYIFLRIRYRRLQVGFFVVGRASEISIGPHASIQFGKDVFFARNFTGHFHGDVLFGDHVRFNQNCYISVHSGLTIGDNTIGGEGVSIHDENHIIGSGSDRIESRGLVAKPITIGKNVWIGAKVTILSGVHIGDNVVIGANAVVTRDVPAYTVVGGVPARVLKELKPSPAAGSEAMPTNGATMPS